MPMAKDNLAQYEQILNSIEHSLKEISIYHNLLSDSLTELESYSNQASNNIHKAWSQVMNLFVQVQQLRSTCFESEQSEQ
ncbi:MAG: hypothetical protein EOP34_09925 [Rickettsiales bacterium]|nr:MAG: hypothetical protein EOP34_09925 [Rickettsiales bacterium]